MFETEQTLQAIVTLLMFAVLIQFCVDRIKDVLGEKIMGFVKAPVWALAFGVLFAFLFQLDVFSMLGLSPLNAVVARLITGLIISAGAAPIHELVERLRQARLNDQLYLAIDEMQLDVENSTLQRRKESSVYAKTDPADQ